MIKAIVVECVLICHRCILLYTCIQKKDKTDAKRSSVERHAHGTVLKESDYWSALNEIAADITT